MAGRFLTVEPPGKPPSHGWCDVNRGKEFDLLSMFCLIPGTNWWTLLGERKLYVETELLNAARAAWGGGELIVTGRASQKVCGPSSTLVKSLLLWLEHHSPLSPTG